MRLTGSIGPRLFRLSWTYWHSRRRPRRLRYWYGYLPDGSACPHRHTRPGTAEECTRKMARRAR